MMMIDGALTLSPRLSGPAVPVAALPASGRVPEASGMSNLRFFLTAYAGGFAFFLAILL